MQHRKNEELISQNTVVQKVTVRFLNIQKKTRIIFNLTCSMHFFPNCDMSAYQILHIPPSEFQHVNLEIDDFHYEAATKFVPDCLR